MEKYLKKLAKNAKLIDYRLKNKQDQAKRATILALVSGVHSD